MIKKLLVALLAVLFVVVAAGGDAVAGKKKKDKKKKINRPNLPPGWVWPPNQDMKEEGRRCLDDLDALGVKWRRAKVTRKIPTPILVPDMELGGVKFTSVWRKGPFVMDCHFALAFARDGGPALRALGVREIRFSGIYNYRNVAGTRTLSRHALGLAIDVISFVTDDGVEHVVKSDYRTSSLFRDIEDAMHATGAYRTLLTPGNDPRHHDDHFHIEARAPRDKPWIPKPRQRQQARVNVSGARID